MLLCLQPACCAKTPFLQGRALIRRVEIAWLALQKRSEPTQLMTSSSVWLSAAWVIPAEIAREGVFMAEQIQIRRAVAQMCPWLKSVAKQ